MVYEQGQLPQYYTGYSYFEEETDYELMDLGFVHIYNFRQTKPSVFVVSICPVFQETWDNKVIPIDNKNMGGVKHIPCDLCLGRDAVSSPPAR